MRWWGHETISVEADREDCFDRALHVLASLESAGEAMLPMSNTERILELTGDELVRELARLQDLWRGQVARAAVTHRALEDYARAHACWREAPSRAAREAAFPAYSASLGRVRELVLGTAEVRRVA